MARKLIELLTTVEFVCVYVEHIYNEIGGGGEANEEGKGNKDGDYLRDVDDYSIDGLWSEDDHVFSTNVDGENLEHVRGGKEAKRGNSS